MYWVHWYTPLVCCQESGAVYWFSLCASHVTFPTTRIATEYEYSPYFIGLYECSEGLASVMIPKLKGNPFSASSGTSKGVRCLALRTRDGTPVGIMNLITNSNFFPLFFN